MMSKLFQMDERLTQFVNNILPHNSFFDAIFSFFSFRGLTVIIWLILFCLFWYQERKDKTHRHFFFAFVASIGITSFIVNIVLKNIVLRTRPWIIQGIMNTGCPLGFSFPSGHASNAFASAFVFAYFDKKRTWLYYGTATLISFSRVYLGCHYVLDVVFGALIGFCIGKVTIWIMTNRKIL